jgi:hypothetical protein
MRYLIFLPIFALLFYSCSTPYQSAGFLGGYKDTLQPNGNYLVEFSGNANTSKQVVTKYLLRRCSELTIQKGFRYFEIVDQHDTHETQNFYNPKGGYSTDAYAGKVEIKFLPEKPKTASESIYDAKLYLEMYED